MAWLCAISNTKTRGRPARQKTGPRTLNLGTAGASDGLSQFEGGFVPDTVEQNGKQFGPLAGVTISDDGTTTALFDNGETRDIYQVPLVTFNNPNGLKELSGNVFVQTTESGVAVAHEAGTGGAGDIAPGRSEEHTSELQSLMRNSYAVFCLTK